NPAEVGPYRSHDPRDGRARVGPFLQQRKPGRQQDDCGSRLGESKNYPEVLWVAGSGESGNHLLTAGQIGKSTYKRHRDNCGAAPVSDLRNHESSLLVVPGPAGG